jgi:hypothetical protein
MKESLKFETIPNKALRANLAVSLAVSAAIAALLLLAAFVDQGFALPAVMMLFCFGRYLFTGTCPGVQAIGRIKNLLKASPRRTSR